MSDEDNLIDDIEETPTNNGDEDVDPTPGAYCNVTDVDSLCGDLSDDVPESLYVTAINNSTSWINLNLNRNRVPIPVHTVIDADSVVTIFNTNQGLVDDESDLNTLRTAAVYYAASDVILTLYHGEDLPVQFDVWFNKAQSFLDAYIEAYWNSEAERDELLNNQMVKHRRGLTYMERRGRRRRY